MEFNNPPFDDAGYCPPEAVWNSRREQFRRLESMAVGKGEHSQDAHEQREPLVREMEHAYCAGAWVATILLAQSIVEITLAFHGYQKHTDRENFLAKYGLAERAKWLRLHRNAIVHRDEDDPAVVTIEQILFDRNSLRDDAKKAVGLSLSVAFLGLKYQDAYSA